MKVTTVCCWCGKRNERKHRPNTQIKLPENWVDRPSMRPVRFLTEGMDPTLIFCSKECRMELLKAEDDIAKKAQREGERIAREIFQSEMRAAILRARGAVVALAEVAEDRP